MSSLDLEALLAPVSESAPSGGNLEYEPEFAALEEAALGKREQQIGNATIPGEPPNFSVLFARSLELLKRSKDLRIAGHLTRAAIEKQSFAGLQQGLALTRQLLQKYWATLHPQLDPDDGNDPTMRISALSAFVSPDLISALRAAPLLVSQVAGPITLRHFAIASGDVSAAGDIGKVDMALLDAGFREAQLAVLQRLAATLESARNELKGVSEAFQAGAGNSGPDLSALDRVLYQAQSIVRPRLAARSSEEVAGQPAGVAGTADGHPSAQPNGASGPGAAALPVAAAPSGVIRNREDVVMLLDKICGYYERHEPSSPLPLLLQRCRRLAALSFLDIVKDLAPAALQQVEVIAGKTEQKK
jgi:type VI secretion system protein ImpA